MIQVSNLSVHFSGNYLFKNVSFLIREQDKIGLVGKNGAGKTTLLRIISGETIAETGVVTSPSGSTIGYLPQEMALGSQLSVIDEIMTAFSEVHRLEAEIENIHSEMSKRTDFESSDYQKLIHRLHDANDHLLLIKSESTREHAEKVLKGLGFKQEEFDRSIATFSGGWQMRVELGKILLKKPDVILLDEPTNHLDIESIQWVEEMLKAYRGALLLVSHDRTFLDKVTNRTVEINAGKIYDFKTGYSEYVKLRQEQLELQQAAFDNQQREIDHIEQFIERFRYKSSKAKQVQSRVKMLEKMERVEMDTVDASAIHFLFPPAPRSGKVILEAENLSKSFGEKQVLKDLDFMIEKGDFVAFVGRNGEGKTTLSKIIVGNLDHEGVCKLGYNVEIGYYAQNQAELLDPERTVFQTIDDIAVGDIRTKIRGLLGSFLFGSEAVDKKVKVLSGGEKARLALLKLLLKPVNLLVLDEPTNHLDMLSKDILKNALLAYDGTLIVVSHDRDFLQGLTNKVFEFKNKTIKPYLGDVTDFLKARKLDDLTVLSSTLKNSSKQVDSKDPVSENKLNYEQRKQQERELRKAVAQVQKIETEINELETKLASYAELLAKPETHADSKKSTSLFREYEAMKTLLEEKMHQWESAQLLVDELNVQKDPC